MSDTKRKPIDRLMDALDRYGQMRRLGIYDRAVYCREAFRRLAVKLLREAAASKPTTKRQKGDKP